MKVLFIIPDYRPDLIIHNGSFFEGIGYMVSVLQEKGIDCYKYQPTLDKSISPLINMVESIRPNLVAYSATTNMIKYVYEWAPVIKSKFPDVISICGGTHASFAPDEVIGCQGIDLVCLGEGEYILLELCNRLSNSESYSNIPGTYAKTSSLVIHNAKPTAPEIDKLPFPAWDFFDIENSFYYKNRFAVLKLSRGCPYQCTYCCNKYLSKLYSGNYVRFMSPNHAIEYISAFLSKYKEIDALAFIDDILPLCHNWFFDFSYKYKQKINLPYTIRYSISSIREDVVKILADTGCYEITFGIESGNEEYRKRVLSRNQSDKEIIQAFSLCNKYGIATRANFMVGLPNETMSDMLMSVKLAAKLHAKFILVCIFFPTPGSDLYDLCVARGYIDNKLDVPDSPYSSHSVLRQPQISSSQICFVHNYFSLLSKLYSIINPAFTSILDSILKSRLLPTTFLNFIYNMFLLTHKKLWKILIRRGVKHYRYRQ